ncbi:glycosyltransferase family 4 protein [Pontibacter arcticus]|uniref:Glycosyltransferase WbuB n=1 Tax=Pontibacter arcticus TaxID=2080288 RepID=A0A364RB71_9BACT|nr:glycosyltransferase family 4 protein [Pontibacter arcticus]RAU81581.1 glycosyltransferase WbuB [Pontibacter arcticus]
MHIAILNQHHHSPDCPATCRHYTFMEVLAKKHRISLVASDAWRRTQITSKYNWVPEGVELHECKTQYANKMGVVKRASSFLKFAASAFSKTMKLAKPDVLWAVSTPLTTPWVVAKVARLRGIPWVFEVQDLWPSFPVAMGAVPGKWMQRKLFRIEKSLYQSAAHIVTLSPDMTDYVLGLGISPEKITTNYNGTDLELAKAVSAEQVENLRTKYKTQGKKVVLYAGTYGRANDMPTLMQTIESMASDESILFICTGTGYYQPQLQQLASRVPNLLLLPPQPRNEIFPLFQLADISLSPFNNLPILSVNSPAKLYDSLANGTPVIVTNPGWTKALVEKYNCGWYTPAEQPEALAQSIKQILADTEGLKIAGQNAIRISEELFDRQKLVKDIEAVLVKAAKLK